MTMENSDTDSIDRPEAVSQILEERSKWNHLFAFTTTHHLPYLTGAALSSAGAAALRTALSIVLGRVFDIVAALGNGDISGTEALHQVSRYCILLLVLAIVQWVVNSAFLSLWIIFGELQASAVRNSLFQKMIQMGKAWIDCLPHGTSGLVASIQRATQELQAASSQILGYLTADILTAVASFAVALSTSWKLTLVLLATVPLSLIVLAFTSRKIGPAVKSQAKYLDSASKILTGSLAGIDHVKLCNGYAHETKSYMSYVSRAAQKYRLQARYNSVQIGFTTFWAVGLFIIGFWYGLALVQRGERPGNVLTTFYAVLSMLQGIESLLPNWLVFEKGMNAGQFLKALDLEVTAMPDDIPDCIRPGYFVGAIDLREVNFSYPTVPSMSSLKQCTMSIPAGELTFLIGRSGSGKTTVAHLVARTYDTLDDSIYMDGIPIKKLQQKWMHEQIMLVEQTPTIFNDTLFRNLTLGHRNPSSVSYQQVLETCRIFGLESTIDTLSGGLHAIIGGKGCPLSGGQRQRIVLARAYLRDPTVLILDEPTSALDQSSRDTIMDAIREWRRGKTTVIISHDLDRIEPNDFVYALDNGTVIEQGFKNNIQMWSLTAASTQSPSQDGIVRDANIEINVIPPRSESSSNQFNNYSFQHLESQAGSWLLSRTNSARYSNLSLLSPRMSILSNAFLNAEPTAMATARLSYVSSLTEPTRPRSSRLLQAYETSQLSSFIDRRFQATSWKASFDVKSKTLRTQYPYADIELVSLSSGDGTTREPKTPKRRRIVERGASTRHQKPGGLSFCQILRTVALALRASAIVYLIFGIFMTIIGALTTPLFSYCLANLLAVMWSTGNKTAEGKQWASILAILAVVDGICTGLGRYCLESSAQSWVDSIRSSALQKIFRQPKAWFLETDKSPSRIIEALDVHCEEMRNLIGRFLPIIVSATTMVSVSVVWSLIICWRLSLVALAPLPLIIAALKGYTHLSSKWEKSCADATEETGSIMEEALTNLRTIHNYSLEDHFIDKYTQAVKQACGLGFKRAWHTCPLFGLYQAFSYSLTALMFYYGTSLLAHSQNASVGNILEVMNLLLFSIGNATELLSAMPQITRTLASASRVLAYTRLSEGEQETEAESQDGRLNPLPVRMRELTFAYPMNDCAATLQNFNLDILPGKCTVIVGSSGSGKSTVLSLILGLYRPASQYSLTYADTPCSMMKPGQLRATIGYVSQTPYLFPATIAENIAFGIEESSPLRHLANIRDAARDASIDDFITALPDGYDTVVGEGGMSLSGGQAQRITIARALARRPSLLVMDEPTSALDTESSAALVSGCVTELMARWKAERRQAAIVVVTHNMEMMRVADLIVVVEDGRNVEQGAFEDMWFSGDEFRRLVRNAEDGGLK